MPAPEQMLSKDLLKEGAARPHASVITFSQLGPSHLRCQAPVSSWLWQCYLPSLFNPFSHWKACLSPFNSSSQLAIFTGFPQLLLVPVVRASPALLSCFHFPRLPDLLRLQLFLPATPHQFLTSERTARYEINNKTHMDV